MYSAVLMLALTAGSDSVDFGRKGGGCSGSYGCSSSYGCSGGYSGCSGSYGCSGYVGSYGCSSYGCSSSCSGRRHGHGKHNRGGCCGSVSYGCTGSYGCSGSYGCTGGYVGGSYGCTGGYVGGNYGCVGGTIINTAPYDNTQPKLMPGQNPAPKGEPLPAPKGKAQAFAPATLIVSLPAGARLSVDGNTTTSTSERRTLITPELEVGSSYVYTLRAELGSNGVQTQQVTVRGGETTTVQFTFAQGVASR